MSHLFPLLKSMLDASKQQTEHASSSIYFKEYSCLTYQVTQQGIVAINILQVSRQKGQACFSSFVSTTGLPFRASMASVCFYGI